MGIWYYPNGYKQGLKVRCFLAWFSLIAGFHQKFVNTPTDRNAECVEHDYDLAEGSRLGRGMGLIIVGETPEKILHILQTKRVPTTAILFNGFGALLSSHFTTPRIVFNFQVDSHARTS